jgi:hypothetical protein
MQFAISFYRIVWKIIVKLTEETHGLFHRDRVMDLTFFFGVFVEVRVRYIHKQKSRSSWHYFQIVIRSV